MAAKYVFLKSGFIKARQAAMPQAGQPLPCAALMKWMRADAVLRGSKEEW